MQKPKAVLFDWDGTIVDTRNAILSAINKTLKDFGKPPIKSYPVSGKTLELFSELFGPDDKKALVALRFNLKSEKTEDLKLFPYIKEALKSLKKHQIFTAVVSNKFCDLLKQEVKATGLDLYFNRVVGSGDTKEDKPSPLPLFYSLSNTGISPNRSDVVFIGDSIVDMQCAKNAGVNGFIYGGNVLEGFDDNTRITNYKNLPPTLCV